MVNASDLCESERKATLQLVKAVLVSNHVIERRHILERIHAATPRAIVFQAAAGYGKSVVARQCDPDALSCDMYRAADVRNIARRLVTVLSAAMPERAAAVDERMRGLGDSTDGWLDLAIELWQAGSRPVIFENAEAFRAIDATAFLDRLFERASARRLLICTRDPLPLRWNRFAYPHEIVRFHADELRFTHDEMHQLFMDLVDNRTMERVAALTRGWPMAVLLLRRIALEGRLAANGGSDVDELFAYVADEVVRTLPPDTLELLLLAAGAQKTDAGDIAGAFGPLGVRRAEEYAAEGALLSKGANSYEVHPLFRALFEERYKDEIVTVIRRAAAAHDTSGQPLAAARRWTDAGDLEAAARSLERVVDDSFLATASLDQAELLTRLDRPTLLAHPRLWSAATQLRAYSVDPGQWAQEGLVIWEGLDDSSAPDERARVAGDLMNAYMNIGMLDRAEQILAALQTETEQTPFVGFLGGCWDASLRCMRAKTVDLAAWTETLAPVLASDYANSLWQYDVCARQYRLVGDREAERVASARAHEAALRTGLPLPIALTGVDGAFGARLAGEDVLFAEYLESLEAHMTANVRPGVAHFIDCARGRGNIARAGFEKRKTRSYGWVIAAATASDDEDRLRFARYAIDAEDQSSQPYAMILARVALYLISEDPTPLRRAESIASELDIPTLTEGLRGLQDRTAPYGQFAGLASRLMRERSVRSVRVAVIDDHVLIDDREIDLTSAQREVVFAIALLGPVDGKTLAVTLRPDADERSATSTMKTLIARIRVIADRRDLIATSTRGYRLGDGVICDVDQTEALLAAWGRGERTTRDRKLLDEALQNTIQRSRFRGDRWEWFGRYERKLDALARSIFTALNHDIAIRADWSAGEPAARQFLHLDPTSETAFTTLINARLAAHNAADAARLVSEHERALNEELGIVGPSPLRALLA